MKSYMAKAHEASEAEKNWWIVDADGETVGRLATHIATLLRGKHKPTYTPGVDGGDFVVVINTAKLQFSGSKWIDKKYRRHSRFFGSLKEKSAEQIRNDNPNFLISEAVWGMLPDNRTSPHLLTHLKTYPGSEHPHAAQKPQPYTPKH